MVLPVSAPKVGSGRDHLQWHRVNVAAPTHFWDEASATESASDLNWTGGKEAGDVGLARGLSAGNGTRQEQQHVARA